MTLQESAVCLHALVNGPDVVLAYVHHVTLVCSTEWTMHMIEPVMDNTEVQAAPRLCHMKIKVWIWSRSRYIARNHYHIVHQPCKVAPGEANSVRTR